MKKFPNKFQELNFILPDPIIPEPFEEPIAWKEAQEIHARKQKAILAEKLQAQTVIDLENNRRAMENFQQQNIAQQQLNTHFDNIERVMGPTVKIPGIKPKF